MVFIQLIRYQLEMTLEFLSLVPGPTGKAALEYVLTEWCSKQNSFYGAYERKARYVDDIVDVYGLLAYYSCCVENRPNRPGFVPPISSQVTTLLGSVSITLLFALMTQLCMVRSKFEKSTDFFIKRLITWLEMGVNKPLPILCMTIVVRYLQYFC